MSLQYIVPINITVVGDGESFDLLLDLERDYVYVAETGYTTFKDKKPVSAAPIAPSAIGYDAKLADDGKLLIHFPAAPAPNSTQMVNVNLFFDGEVESDVDPAHPDLVGGSING